ncbi:MAG: sigma 54-interacting transcriptional regulator [Holophagales bacterium]|nr:sigma 54-interacting transcriptional regulator [Holophagales bacterium]
MIESGHDTHPPGFEAGTYPTPMDDPCSRVVPPAEPGFCLQWQAEGAFRLYPLQIGANRIGRNRRNDIVLPAPGLSREHAVLRLEGDRLSIRDEGSTNGTRVNGRQVAEAELTPGDRLHLGSIELEVVRRNTEDLTLAFHITRPENHHPVRAPTEHATDPLAPRGSGPDPTEAAIRQGCPEPELVFPPGYVAGRSEAMGRLYRQMGCLLRGRLPVLLLGETGVGKEHLAQILHASSDRASGPLVALNCAAIPAELLEAEMFGIAGRVATGVDPRAGRFRQADGGTLFLDEIDSMPLPFQAKLLRALEDDRIQPVGGDPVSVNVRILAAANSDLQVRIERGELRRDLYYRLAGYELRVPPLRERSDDIPALVEHFVRQQSALLGKRVEGMSVAAMEDLLRRPWPGNVRELRNEVRRLVLFCPDGEAIRTSHLPEPAPASPLEGWVESLAAEDGNLDLGSTLAKVEAELVRLALRRTDGNKAAAARMLGVSRNGLRIKLQRLGLCG